MTSDSAERLYGITMSMDNTKQTILVTGGAGFVGSHLCRRLHTLGHRVISLDNYFTGSKENHVDGVEYREGHTKNIEKHIPESVDKLYHLGEYSRVAASLDEPEVVFDLNMTGTFGVVEYWRRHKCKLVYAGSSTKTDNQREDGVSGRDLAPYTWMKAANTDLVRSYSRWYDLSYATMYFYNVYGPGERSIEQYGTVIESFHQQWLSGGPLQVRKPGTSPRAFTHVDDTIDGIILVGENGEGDNYGIGTDETYSLLEVTEMYGGEVKVLPERKTSRRVGAVDSSKVRELGWKPKKDLPTYVKEIVEQGRFEA